MVQIWKLENIEHKSMKQISYSGKYSLSASRTHHSHAQFSFVVGDAYAFTGTQRSLSVLIASVLVIRLQRPTYSACIYGYID